MKRYPRERFVEHALALIAQAEVAPPESAGNARRLLNDWCANSPEHEAAAREARRRWDALGSLSADLRTHFKEPAALPPLASQRQSSGQPDGRLRRKMLLTIATLSGLGALGAKGLHWHLAQPVFMASYDTATARMLKVTLPDGADDSITGSQLDLAPKSRIAVALYRDRRNVELTQGEVRFAISPDASRPFFVKTREAVIEVVGTEFTVRDRGGAVTVGVEHGHVRVRVLPQSEGGDTPQPGAAVDLLPGQSLDVRDGQADAIRQTPPADLAAWRDGWLVFDNTALGEALSTINAYRPQPIASSDPRVRMLRLSGRFRSNDSAGLLAVLPTILPLTARTRPDGSVELRGR